ncbi:MAG: hypothetical protein SFX73_27610 [Kofleriaceae bacterium]|nr:hypothetical protein [Kofleriaceae bacterium]
MRSALLAIAVIGCGGGSSEVDEYKRKSMETEARVQLNKLSKLARVVHTEKGAYPIGSTGLTPNKPCCQYADKRCPPSADAWNTDVWAAFDFVVDEPHRFQYSYESKDGQTFTATAVGDVACAGTPKTFTITGKTGPAGAEVDISQIR